MQDGAVTMPQHGEELHEQDTSEKNEETKSERFESQRLVVETRYGYVDVVADFILNELQVKYDHHPESVDHEEGKAAVVAQRF